MLASAIRLILVVCASSLMLPSLAVSARIAKVRPTAERLLTRAACVAETTRLALIALACLWVRLWLTSVVSAADLACLALIALASPTANASLTRAVSAVSLTTWPLTFRALDATACPDLGLW